MLSSAKMNLFLLYMFYYSVIASGATQAGNESLTVCMNNPITFENREMYGEFITVQNYSTLKVNFTELPGTTNFSFLVFQAHSFKNKIILYRNQKSKANVVCGTNVGMVSIIKHDIKEKPKISDEYYIENIKNVNVRVYVSVHVYYETDPFPGGCNIESQTDIAPYLTVKTRKDYIEVDAAVASLDSKCTLSYDNLGGFYMMYLPEMRFNEWEYFNGLRKMMTLENIQEYGTMIPQTSFEMRRTLSAYPGTGVIIVAVAMVAVDNTTGYSVYVPNHSYGCPYLDENGCRKSHDIFTQAVCMALSIVGLFVAFYGHRNIQIVMFLSGFTSGFVLSYIAIGVIAGVICGNKFGLILLITTPVITGLLVGTTWLLLWCMYGVPVFAMFLPSINLAFLVVSYLFYAMPPLGLVVVEDAQFWSLFILMVLLATAALISRPYSSNILGCAVIGAYVTVFGMDCCVDSNVQYIIINIIRRAVIPKFRYAVVAPIFQRKEMTMFVLWVSLALGGWTYQHWTNRGRRHFPLPPRRKVLAAKKSTVPAVRDKYGAANTKRAPKQQELPSIVDTLRAFKNYWIRQLPDCERTPLVTGS